MIARVPCITTLAGARAAVEALAKARDEEAISLQERHAGRQAGAPDEQLWPEATSAAS
jgi:hypothetical protein